MRSPEIRALLCGFSTVYPIALSLQGLHGMDESYLGLGGCCSTNWTQLRVVRHLELSFIPKYSTSISLYIIRGRLPTVLVKSK